MGGTIHLAPVSGLPQGGYLGLNTTVKVAVDWASDAASDLALYWATHSTLFNHSKVEFTKLDV